MTVLVGVKCSDGVVIGADSMVTSAVGRNPLFQFAAVEKVRIAGNKAVMASTGGVGHSQRFEAILTDNIGKQTYKSATAINWGSLLARETVQNFGSTQLAMPNAGFQFGALVAAPIGNSGELIEFASLDFQPEVKAGKLFFVSMGSGQNLAEPFLAFIARVLWKGSPPSVQEAVFGVSWALSHCITYAPGGVGGDVCIGTLQKVGQDWKAETLEAGKLAESQEHIALIEKLIGEYPRSVLSSPSVEAPPTPPGG